MDELLEFDHLSLHLSQGSLGILINDGSGGGGGGEGRGGRERGGSGERRGGEADGALHQRLRGLFVLLAWLLFSKSIQRRKRKRRIEEKRGCKGESERE